MCSHFCYFHRQHISSSCERGTFVNNDSPLTANERNVLNEAILAYKSLFKQVTTGCYANASWWGSSSVGGGIQMSGFFSGLGKVIREIINWHATFLTKLAKGAIQDETYGLGIGAPFGMEIQD